MRLALYFILLFASNLYAVRDSSRIDFRMKGVDISVGAALHSSPQQLFVQMLQQNTEVDPHAPYHYPYDSKLHYFKNKDKNFIDPIKVQVGFIFSNDLPAKSKLIQRRELGIQLGFESAPTDLHVSGITAFDGRVDSIVGRMRYTYQSQRIGVKYQFAGKPFLKHFALFAGFAFDGALLSIKRIDDLTYKSRQYDRTYYNVNNQNSVFLAGTALLGMKYNFSCDLNFYVQVDVGMNCYFKYNALTNVFQGFNFGMRYKLIDEFGSHQSRNSAFW